MGEPMLTISQCEATYEKAHNYNDHGYCIHCRHMSPELETQGLKYDNEKPDLSLISPVAMNKLAQVLTHGKAKYSAHNWRKGIAWSRIIAGVLRHIMAYMGGERRDPESGLSHLAHAMCGLMFLLEYEDTRRNFDDLYKEE